MGWDLPSDTTKRGSLPSLVEYFILAYVGGEKNNWNFAKIFVAKMTAQHSMSIMQVPEESPQ